METAPESRQHVDAPASDRLTEEVYETIIDGLRTFARDMPQVFVGLSGGVDSALVAALATAALGNTHVWGVAMPGPFSSEHSLTDARALAERLNIRFDVLPISPIYDSFLSVLHGTAAAPGPFSGTERSVAEENLQARIRGALLMSLSNKFGGVVLATGNRSEALVGYFTLYGDAIGALAVIGDCYKTGAGGVYALAERVNREGEVIPRSTLQKPPSAELAPGQRDDQALPPYEELDPILRSLVDEGRSVDETAEATGADVDRVGRVAALVRRNAFKREQTPPVLEVPVLRERRRLR